MNKKIFSASHSKKPAIKNAYAFKSWLGSTISLYPTDSNKANSPMEVVQPNQSLATLEQQKKDLYFVVNKGGTRQNQITELVANFIDLDAGRDNRGRYYDARTVARKKKAMLKRVGEFQFKPSAVVETRNGYQLYWKLLHTQATKQYYAHGATNVSKWNKIQKSIYSFFHEVGADSKAMKVNQIMRLPFTTWYKSYEGKTPFKVKLVSYTNQVYTLDELWDSLQDVSWASTAKLNKYSPDSWHGKKEARFDKSKWTKNRAEANPGPGASVGQGNAIADTVAFLTEIAGQIRYKGMSFSASVATTLAERLTKEYL